MSPREPTALSQRVWAYIRKNFEQSFVLLTLVATALINYFIPDKTAFLNFYFLPVILTAYYLGRRKGVLAAFLCVLVVSAYVILFPERFDLGTTRLDAVLRLLTWGGFLILAAAMVGTLQDKLTAEIATTRRLNAELQQKQGELIQTNISLEQSRAAIDVLKRKVEETLYATMDSVVANMIIEDRLLNEKRNVSVLFADIARFTTYAEEHPPEVVIRELNRYLSEVEPILFAYRGHIDKYMGDGVMCEFGAPLDLEMHQLLAVLAGLKLQEKMSKRNYPWDVRVGIASGATVTGIIGVKRQTYTAIGDVVNLAARLQQNCSPQRVLIDASTHEGVKRYVDARKKRNLPMREIVDWEKERQLQALFEKISAAPDEAELHFQIGKIHLEIDEVDEALANFERALEIDPDNVQFKVGYAEAGLKARQAERIGVKGKRQRIEVYEVIRLKDCLQNRDKFPQAFIDKFGAAADLIQIPDDVVLPVEALDGSIGHSRSVAVIAYALASHFQLTEREKLDILHAGFVADIGKESIPSHQLNRRGRLTPSELEIVKQHPVESTRILKKLGYENEAILDIVLHSHEYFNGSGYPGGLKGEDIPLGSRIVAVADAYDALTSWRSYRDVWERSVVLDEIERGMSRGLYDPTVVEALKQVMA